MEIIISTINVNYTVIPRPVADATQLMEVERRRRFRIASGEVVEYPVAEAYIVEGRG